MKLGKSPESSRSSRPLRDQTHFLLHRCGGLLREPLNVLFHRLNVLRRLVDVLRRLVDVLCQLVDVLRQLVDVLFRDKNVLRQLLDVLRRRIDVVEVPAEHVEASEEDDFGAAVSNFWEDVSNFWTAEAVRPREQPCLPGGIPAAAGARPGGDGRAHARLAARPGLIPHRRPARASDTPNKTGFLRFLAMARLYIPGQNRKVRGVWQPTAQCAGGTVAGSRNIVGRFFH